jgi:hypothetical protein
MYVVAFILLLVFSSDKFLAFEKKGNECDIWRNWKYVWKFC